MYSTNHVTYVLYLIHIISNFKSRDVCIYYDFKLLMMYRYFSFPTVYMFQLLDYVLFKLKLLNKVTQILELTYFQHVKDPLT